jgi:HEAT repeat protein
MLATLAALAALVELAAPPPPKAPPEPEVPVATLVKSLASWVEMDCGPLRALVSRGPKVWPELEVGLDDPDEMVRFWTLGVLSEVPVAAARPRLIALMKDKTVRIRAAAAFALGAQRHPEVVPPLIEALVDSDVNVRFEAASALGRVPDPRAVEPLLTSVQDPDEDVRGAVCDALGAIGDARAIPPLVTLLKDDRKSGVRGRAALALGSLKAKDAFDTLVKRATRERDPEALAAMCWALGELGDARAIATLEPLTRHANEVVRKHASDAVAALSPKPEAPKPDAPKP